jgi:cell division protein FtsL
MRDLSLTLSQPFKSKSRGGTSASGVASSLPINLALLSLIVTIGFLYIFQVNTLGTRGYEIRQLEQQVKALDASNKQLQIQSSSLSSITKIQKDAEAFRMVPATNVTYIKDAGFALK